MSAWLYLTDEGSAAPSAQWPCCLVSATGEQTFSSLNELAATLQAQSIVLVLPMEMCCWVHTEKWPSRRRPDVQAVAFAVEEQLSEDLETLHLSIGTRDRLGRYGVWVINRKRFAQVLALMADLGIRLSAVQVDADRLPCDQPYGVWWLGRWLIGGAQNVRMALPSSALENVKARLPDTTCWLDSGFEVMHGQASTIQPSNLLQGDFSQKPRRATWMTVLLSALLLFALSWGSIQARGSFYEAQAQRLYTISEQRFRNLYPQQTRIVDLSAQFQAMQKHNRTIPQDTQISRLSKLTEQVIGASGVEVQRIEYRLAEGWKLQLTTSSFEHLELLRERGKSSGFPIRLGTASKVQQRVEAVLTLEDPQS